MKHSPLHLQHVEAGARLVEFGGWQMPVQYNSILDEHRAVREGTGVFDISHMGNIVISGSGASAWINSMLSNDVTALTPGKGHYTFMLNESGGVIDDLLLYALGEDIFYMVLNAACLGEDLAWLHHHQPEGITLDNRSNATGSIALQGPRALEILSVALPDFTEVPKRNRIATHTFEGRELFVARTGYTGEDGVELFVDASKISALWSRLVANGALPCGLGARDLLRLEASLPLNGSDMRPDITPLQAGFERFVALDKPDGFIGRDALVAQHNAGIAQKLVAFTMQGKSPPPRAHYTVHLGEEQIGEVTSGIASPSLSTGIGFALIDSRHGEPGTHIDINIRNKRYPALVAKRPLYKRSSK